MSFLELKDLKVHFPIRGGIFNTIQDWVYAVDGVSMIIEEGKTYGLVGESGSGKTTIGKAIVGLEDATDGQVIYNDVDVTNKARNRGDEYLDYNRDIQMIFQDSTSSLNPKKRIKDIIGEPMRNYFSYTDQEEKNEIIRLLEIVGLNAEAIYRYPHEFSGGQRQRIGVARAVASDPKLIIADEPTSALDLSVQAQVLNFMKEIQEEYGLSYLFISHDLSVVKHMADDIAIMHRGRFVERGTKAKIFNNPQHIYTRRLLSAIPKIDPINRDQHTAERRAVEQEYQEQEIHYYDENGRVYDLQLIDDEHWVALNPNNSSTETLVTEQQEGGN
jgi:peptide/nickel transport system ATP-binding protein